MCLEGGGNFLAASSERTDWRVIRRRVQGHGQEDCGACEWIGRSSPHSTNSVTSRPGARRRLNIQIIAGADRLSTKGARERATSAAVAIALHCTGAAAATKAARKTIEFLGELFALRELGGSRTQVSALRKDVA
jgi:hypothetical protein